MAETGRDIQNGKQATTNDHNEEADASNDAGIKGGSDSKNNNSDDDDDDENDEDDGDEEKSDTAKDTRLDSDNEFGGPGVATSPDDKVQTEIIGQKAVNISGQESNRAQLLATNSSNSNALEPLEYDSISLDDSEEAWLGEEEPENNNRADGKSGTNNGITREATSSDKSSPLVRQVDEEGQEEDEDEETKEDEEEDEDESEDQENNEADDNDDNDDNYDEQVQDEAELDDDEPVEEGKESEEGRFRHLPPVLAQNLSGFWLAGSASGGRELKLQAANSMVRLQEDRIKTQRQRQRQRRRRKGKQEGSRLLRAKKGRGEKNDENDENENKLKIDSEDSFSNVVKHKKKIKGVSKHLMYLESQPEVYSKLKEEEEERKANIKPHNFQNGALIPLLETQYAGKVRENERLVELTPKLRILNQVEVCDIELFALSPTKDNSNDAYADHHNNHHVDYNVKNKKHFMNKEHQHSNNIMPTKFPLLSSANIISLEDKQQEEEQIRKLPFIVSWIDRINGEATLEAKSEKLMNCERERNYTFKMRAIGCNGLHSNE